MIILMYIRNGSSVSDTELPFLMCARRHTGYEHQLLKPPCTERQARWCERTAVNHRLLPDYCIGDRIIIMIQRNTVKKRMIQRNTVKKRSRLLWAKLRNTENNIFL